MLSKESAELSTYLFCCMPAGSVRWFFSETSPTSCSSASIRPPAQTGSRSSARTMAHTRNFQKTAASASRCIDATAGTHSNQHAEHLPKMRNSLPLSCKHKKPRRPLSAGLSKVEAEAGIEPAWADLQTRPGLSTPAVLNIVFRSGILQDTTG